MLFSFCLSRRDFIVYRYPGKPPTHATDNGFEDKVSRSEGSFPLFPCQSVFLVFLELDEVCSFFPDKEKLMGRDDCNIQVDFCDIRLVPVQTGSYWSIYLHQNYCWAKGRSIKDRCSVFPCIWPFWCFLEQCRCGCTIMWLLKVWCQWSCCSVEISVWAAVFAKVASLLWACAAAAVDEHSCLHLHVLPSSSTVSCVA